MDKIFNAINNLKITDAKYELNKASTSDRQGNIMSDPDIFTHTSNRPDIVTHTSNGILDENY